MKGVRVSMEHKVGHSSKRKKLDVKEKIELT
jgi:hypothetical protein